MPQPMVPLFVAALLVAGVVFRPFTVQAQLLPVDVGATVAGFQDDFDGTTLDPNWAVRGQNVFSVSGSMLHVSSATGDPNHLLYELAGYNNSVQEVLARIRVTSFSSGDPARAGIATAIDPLTSQGINLHFRDEPNLGQRHMELLDDARAWGPEYALSWQNNTWYWLRLRHEPNAVAQGGVNDVFGKTWLADGSQAEPASWQMTWDYIPTRSARTGFAGVTAGSLGGTSEFDVDYILIKASGLPNIVVAPGAFVQVPAAITNQPQSQTVMEGAAVTLVVGAAGMPRPTFQWYCDNDPIAGATQASYSIAAVPLSDDGAVFKVVVENLVSNITYSVTSSNAVLSVIPDAAPPYLLVVQSIGLTQVQVMFSERVTLASAADPGHYLITNSSGSVTVSNAVLDASQSNVVLNVSPMQEGAVYALVVSDIRDTSSAGNLIAPNTSTNFTAVAFAPIAIGDPQPTGGAVAVEGGLNLTGGGRDIGGTSDQFQFSYQTWIGDFDVRVRIDSLSLADTWSEAGLLAREDLTAGGRFAGAMATPTISGSYFQYRNATNGTATLTGSFPVNYPQTWLRLKRVGSQFTGYGGFDGQDWAVLGSVSIPMPATVFLGFAASSHDTNQTTTAAFRGFGNVTTAGVLSGPLPREPLGQSSQRTSLVISEIMYHPPDRADGRNLEFVELYNTLGTPQDLSGWRLDQDADFTFPPNTSIPAGSFLVVAQSPADVESVYGITGVLGPFSNTNSLPNTRGTIQLRNRIGAVFLEARYDSEAPWPAAADGAGHSLVLAQPSFGEGTAAAWAASDAVGGSPGRLDPFTADPLRSVVVNEFLAHTDDPELDFIELYNHSNREVDISGCYLSDARNTNKFTIPPNTLLPPRGFTVFDQTRLGFALSSGGETIYFRNPSNTRVLDAVRFEAQARGVSSGRYPDGAPGFAELVSTTPGTTNHACLIRDIVINEILYHPITLDSDDEFVELHNRGDTAVSLAGWRMTGGISFAFPTNAAIAAHGYLVVARNAARLFSRYPSLNTGNTVGDYGGSLADGGERLALAIPDPWFTTNQNIVTTNFNYVVVDEVTYRDGGRWGQWSDGGGSSLELIDARSDNRLAPNWADSDEATKAPWTTVSVRGVVDNGTSAADQLQVLLQGRGECLIDDVEVLTATGVNLITNSTFESSAGGWTAEGTEESSGWETAEGFNSSRCYHVRASDRGDNQINRIRTPLSTTQNAGVTLTIRAKVRWLRGHPEILFRLRGNWLEAAAAMDLPAQLGTPGARNSRALTNAAPAIYDVAHYPPVPAAGAPIVVTARAADPDGVGSVQLRYRLDPNATLMSVAMLDNGTGGDAVAGDGLYSATIPAQPVNTLVAFQIRATDGFAPSATSTFPDNAPVRECLVRFGETLPAGNFPSYRIWMTQATFNTWDARNNLDNRLNDVTFVLGNHRVIYNAGAVFAGSPYIAPGFTTPNGNRCGYTIEFPPDDPFLGDTALVLDWPGGHGNENTGIQEQMAYWIAEQIDLAYSHRYFIRLAVNGVTDLERGGVFEAVLQPAGGYLEQWSPGHAEGDFFKIDRAFEFSDAGGLIADPEPQLRVYSTPDLVTGGTKKKTEKYRWYWLKRSYDHANDYTNVFIIADVLNAASPEPYTAQTEALVDVEQWMQVFAVEHIINNFDSWGHDIGKNMYMFKPTDGRWQLYMFDLDWLMLVSPGGPGNYTATTGPLFSSDDPTVTRMYNHPPFRRAYFRAVQDTVDKAFAAPKYEAMMDAKYASLVANGITLCDGQALAAPTALKTWFSQRRGYLVGQLEAVAANFAITSNSGNDFTTNRNVVSLDGTAPIAVNDIRVDGVAYPVTWIGVSNWTMRVPLSAGLNTLTLEAYDPAGQPLTNYTDTIRVTSTATEESPEGLLVMNEIMYRPVAPEAEFVEILNGSATTAFDLSGWRLDGVDFTFPNGTLIEPGAYLVLAEDRDTFAAAYGGIVPVLGEFAGRLDGSGETLSLIKPGSTPDQDRVVDRVRYDSEVPWPGWADGQGSSLQLIDAVQDNSRVSNWSDGQGWRFFRVTGVVGGLANRVILSLAGAGDLYIDNIELVQGSQPGVGTNLLQNEGFESGSLAPWTTTRNHSNTTVTAETAFAGNYSMHLIATGPGSTGDYIVQSIVSLNSTSTCTLSFYYLPVSPNHVYYRVGSGLTDFVVGYDVTPVLATPGKPNSMKELLPPYDPIWLNEVLPQNSNGLTDSQGQADPWIELYNAGTNAVSLDGVSLANSYLNLLAWSFPPNTIIDPGQFLVVWADGEPGQSTSTEFHTSFRLTNGTGSIVLSRSLDGVPQILDYFNFNAVPADWSYGAVPDGQPFDRRTMFHPTPGSTNEAAAPPLPVYINEWVAANTGASGFADPTDGDYDDWFELFNPGPDPADLAGYFLTDNLTNQFQYRIPAGYVIPPGGFLLVWADNEPEQNGTNWIDLHASFALRQSGEAIGLFAADGTPIDTVTFGAQTNNISQGHYPDGAGTIYWMPVPTPRAPNVIPQPLVPPTLTEIRLEAGGTQVRFSVETVPGGTYRVEYKDDLNAPVWQVLMPDTVAAGSTLEVTDSIGTTPQRFYRVVRVN